MWYIKGNGAALSGQTVLFPRHLLTIEKDLLIALKDYEILTQLFVQYADPVTPLLNKLEESSRAHSSQENYSNAELSISAAMFADDPVSGRLMP